MAEFCGMGVCFGCCGEDRIRTCMPRPDSPIASGQVEAGVVIVGAGPAGLAAASCAGAGAVLIDENATAGGQIWRGESKRGPAGLLTHTSIVCSIGPRTLLAQRGDQAVHISYERLILCTGARERSIPFPGWTLPHVTGAGGLQALVKNGLPIRGKRIVVAGSGPLLLAVAAYLKQRGARIAAIAEQASGARVRRFAMQLIGTPAKLLQAVALRASLAGVPYYCDAWIVETSPGEVMVEHNGRRRRIECDSVAAGYGLVPNIELALALGCSVENGVVAVDEVQRTSVPGIWCAGEPTGIGGAEAAQIEGRIAGLAASGDIAGARALIPLRDRTRRFAARLEETFALRPELMRAATGDTIVCRCEQVTLGAIRKYASWREAKLQSRCGMGPCQARVCGPAAEGLLGWRDTSWRPPVLPATVAVLASSNTNTKEGQAG